MKKKLMFYCQSLLGIGHYVRSREIVRALAAFDVCFVYGGEMIPGFGMPPGVEVIHLPALKSDANFQQLHLIDEQLNLAEVKARRCEQLLGIYERVQPAAIVIELYPFGRRMFDFELLPLLEKIQASTPAPKVICSLRDILVARKNQTKFDNEACALMNQYFDLLLVHADPNLQRLEETFPRVKDLQCDVRYTGFVVQSRGVRTQDACVDEQRPLSKEITNPANRTQDACVPRKILVSIGGGRIGHELIECAIAASALLNTPHRLHILTGPHCPDEIYAQLQQQIAARPHLTMERFTPDLPAYLQQADLSLSMAGYNTCMDIVSAGIRAIVYPFTGSDNQEQMMRARKLERLGAMTVLTPEQLTPEQLAQLLQQALQAPPVAAPIPLDLQGATKTAQALAELLQA